jgi:hypothetical protein
MSAGRVRAAYQDEIQLVWFENERLDYPYTQGL